MKFQLIAHPYILLQIWYFYVESLMIDESSLFIERVLKQAVEDSFSAFRFFWKS